MCKNHGLEVHEIDCEWGTGVPLDEYEKVLSEDKNHEIKAVLACQNETATGVTSDIGGVRKVLDKVGHPALLFVDSVSALASVDFRFDDWKVDMCVMVLKGLMLPAGLGILCVSQKALGLTSSAGLKRDYFDLDIMLNANKLVISLYSSTSLFRLREALAVIEEEGLDNIIARHHYLAEGARAAVFNGWGLKLCAKEPKWYSDTVTAVMLPDGVNGADIILHAFKRYNVSLGAGLSKVAGKLFQNRTPR